MNKLPNDVQQMLDRVIDEALKHYVGYRYMEAVPGLVHRNLRLIEDELYGHNPPSKIDFRATSDPKHREVVNLEAKNVYTLLLLHRIPMDPEKVECSVSIDHKEERYAAKAGIFVVNYSRADDTFVSSLIPATPCEHITITMKIADPEQEHPPRPNPCLRPEEHG